MSEAVGASAPLASGSEGKPMMEVQKESRYVRMSGLSYRRTPSMLGCYKTIGMEQHPMEEWKGLGARSETPA